MSPNCRRSALHNAFLAGGLLLALLVTGFAVLASLTRKSAAALVAPGFAKAKETIAPAPGIALANRTRLRESFGRLPLSFEANQGQADGSVKFLSRGSGYGLFLTSTEAVLRMKFEGANAAARMEGVDQF